VEVVVEQPIEYLIENPIYYERLIDNPIPKEVIRE